MQRLRPRGVSSTYVRKQVSAGSSGEWAHPFGVDTVPQQSTANCLPENFILTYSGNNSLSADTYHNRAAQFAALHAALRNMSMMPEGHSLHVDLEVATKAADRLGVIAHSYDIMPPKIMAEDDGSVVLTWDFGQFKRYLTIDLDGTDLLDLHKKSAVKCLRQIDEDNENIVDVLGITPVAVSSIELDV